MRVRAKRVGEYKGKVYDIGDVFDIEDNYFSDIHHEDSTIAPFGWMEKVDDTTPLGPLNEPHVAPGEPANEPAVASSNDVPATPGSNEPRREGDYQ